MKVAWDSILESSSDHAIIDVEKWCVSLVPTIRDMFF